MVVDHRLYVSWQSKGVYDADDVEFTSYLIDTTKPREHWASYLGDITGMDNLFGMVKDIYTEDLGNDDYLSMYTSDHGAQWAFGKWNFYERGVCTPLIVQWNSHVKVGKRIDAMVSWIDIKPTLEQN